MSSSLARLRATQRMYHAKVQSYIALGLDKAAAELRAKADMAVVRSKQAAKRSKG